jgi:hypothetical protein
MGGAAAAAMLTGGGTRKDHTSNGHENKAELSQKADQPAHPSDLDKPDLPRDNSGSRLGDSADRLAGEAADRFGMLWKGPDNLTLSIRQASRTADTFLDCQDILAGGVSAIWQEYLGCTRRTLEMSFAHLQEMARCRSPETLIASQADLTVKQVDLRLQSGVRIVDLSARAASPHMEKTEWPRITTKLPISRTMAVPAARQPHRSPQARSERRTPGANRCPATKGWTWTAHRVKDPSRARPRRV